MRQSPLALLALAGILASPAATACTLFVLGTCVNVLEDGVPPVQPDACTAPYGAPAKLALEQDGSSVCVDINPDQPTRPVEVYFCQTGAPLAP